MKRTIAISLLSLLVTLFAGAQTAVYEDVSQPLERRIDDALSRMTLQEKVGLCHAWGKFYSGGVPRLGIPGLWMSDGPHGVRAEMDWNEWRNAGWTTDSCTAFPSLTCLAATWNPQMAERYGRAIGEEAAYRGKNVLLGPGVNIYRTPLNGRNFEYMGEDPVLSATMCVPYIQGVQSQGVACCVKHYALNNQETHRWHINVECSERALRELYLPAFRAAVERGKAWSLMGAYNKIRGTHASHNAYTLNEILKKEWGFDGAVVSDWDATHNMREAALGGLDIEMGTSQRRDKGISAKDFTFDESYLGNDFLAALQRGELPESVVDEKARRVLRLIFRTAMNPNRKHGNQDYAAHSAVARQIADEGIVLLQNRKALPLKGHRLLIVGDNAVRKLTEGGGSSELKVQHETSVLAAMQAEFGADRVKFAQGYLPGRTDYEREHSVAQHVTDSLREQAVSMAREADYVIVVGGLNKNKFQDTEDADRKTYDLPFGQPELIEALARVNKNIVVVLMSGNAVAMPWADRVGAVLQAWYLGSETGPAVVDVLTGRVNPSGRLPFSIPVKLEDCAAHSFGAEAYPGDGKTVVYKEDVLVGYRWHDTKRIAPRFPFGHGLSYTTFRYGKATVEKQGDDIAVTVPVRNTGSVAGKEVVQLYVGEDRPTVLRPQKELKAFQKVLIQPGETQNVTLRLTPSEDFAFYDESSRSWQANRGTYTLYIGASSGDIRQQLKFIF
ncbi:MAG: glycoside hydrolase family 3 C-terminal domain-containing protein [Bacteroidaceae bacterium]|nr:glycoside hydrolase family 3 C-terminal domain-containing protein [Bacteroidaceae bacterium]